MTSATSARSLPDMIAVLKQRVQEDMAPDDVSARELIDHLDMAWCAAERWRIEQWSPDFANGEGAFAEPRHA